MFKTCCFTLNSEIETIKKRLTETNLNIESGFYTKRNACRRPFFLTTGCATAPPPPPPPFPFTFGKVKVGLAFFLTANISKWQLRAFLRQFTKQSTDPEIPIYFRKWVDLPEVVKPAAIWRKKLQGHQIAKRTTKNWQIWLSKSRN